MDAQNLLQYYMEHIGNQASDRGYGLLHKPTFGSHLFPGRFCGLAVAGTGFFHQSRLVHPQPQKLGSGLFHFCLWEKIWHVGHIPYSQLLHGDAPSLPDSTSVVIPKGDITADVSGDFDAWYVFNGNKFSYSAPFTMMQIQKRSAGSAILGLSVRNGFSVFEGISYNDKEKMSLMTNILALGGGYAHNFITPHQWLIHVSVVGNLSVLSYNVLQTSTETTMMKNTYPDWVGTFQFSVLHWTQRWFYGFNFSLRGAVYGTMDNLEFTNARTEAHLVVGCRL